MTTKMDTVIFSESYIEEIERHIAIWEQRYETERMPETKSKYKKMLDSLKEKLEWSLDFQDTISEIRNGAVANLTTIKTVDGHEFPLKHVKIV